MSRIESGSGIRRIARRISGGLVGFALVLGACRAPESRAIPEDLNAGYLDPEMEVGRMVDRFEGESREVYRERETIAEALRIQPGQVVADIGAGTGAFLAALSRRAGPEGRVIATDISSVFVAELRKRAEREGLENVQAQLVGERECGLAPGSVDRILICDVYHHFAYPRTTNRTLHAALRPGGELILVDFHRIPGVTRPWLLSHVRAGMEVFRDELLEAGFELVDEVDVAGLDENYVLRFKR